MAQKEDTSYQKYLEDKHLGFATPESLISSMVKKATGSEALSIEKLIQGEVNEVYDVVAGGQNIIVRISRQGPENFETEETIIRIALQAGVPAPKVLLLESASTETEELTFCIEEKIEGKPLKELLKTLDSETLKAILVQSGEILSRIHSLETDRFGPLDRQVFYHSWTEYLFRKEENRREIIEYGAKVGLLPDVVDKAFSIQKQNLGVLEIQIPYILHGDFSPKHILTNGKTVTGIIDFEDAKGGDPVRDIAWMNFFYEDSVNLDWFLEGYDKNKTGKDFELKMRLLKLNLGLDLLDYYGSEGNISGLKFSKRKLEEEVAKFI